MAAPITDTGRIGANLGEEVSWTLSSALTTFADGKHFDGGGAVPWIEIDTRDWYLENALRTIRSRGFID